MNRKLRTLPFLLALAAVGCQPEPTALKTDPPARQESTGATTGTTASAPTTSPEAAAPSLDTVPAELKHDGYAYYGLGNTKPMVMEIVDSTQPGRTMTGSQTIKLTEVKDGKAVFDIERTDDLAQLGTQSVTLEKDGIYVTASSVAQVNHDLELPADVTAGKKWQNTMKVDAPGREVEMKSTFKIEGNRKVKTKVGDREAILITSTGQGTMLGQKVRMESQNWYVKDVGGVKAVIKITYGDGKTRTMTIQETP
ncbi:MAG: hypothetical protein ACO1SV_19840 [Fimbriimonas sp.]